jgi:hypothetical protein
MAAHRPAYIPESILSAPLQFVWQGATEHIGPTETVTKLLDRLSGTTTCAQITMCAGVFEWGAWRLSAHTPVDYCLELAEAAFAYQVDWRYVNPDAGPVGKAPDQPAAISATMQLTRFMRSALDKDEYWNSYYQPIRETFHCAHLVEHILPKQAKKGFQAWLDGLAERIMQFWPKPDEPFRKKKEFATVEEHQSFIARHRGVAVPRELLDPDFPYRPEMREQLVAEYLERLDWKVNRYLRSPEDMLKIGFEGTPYRLR